MSPSTIHRYVHGTYPGFRGLSGQAIVDEGVDKAAERLGIFEFFQGPVLRAPAVPVGAVEFC